MIENYDALARAMMACRPDLPQDMSLDEWIVQHSNDLTGPEERAARAILYLHLNQG